MGSGMTEPGRREQVVEALRELGADRGGQLLDALEMIIEGPLRDARGVHDGIDRERFRRPLGKKDFRCFQDLRPGSGALFAPNFCPPRQIDFRHHQTSLQTCDIFSF